MLIFVLFVTYNEAFAQPAGYLYRVRITIAPPTGCGGGNLNDFPILIEHTAPVLRSVANGGVVNNTNGYDVVFTAANGNTLLDFQLDHYNATTGNYAAWVRMNNFSLTAATDIYMYYGNPSVTTNQSTTNTWNASFETVYHFQSDNFLDGTVNAVNGTNNGTIDLPGAKIGGGRTFDGTNDYIQGNSTVLKTANNLTISTWLKASSTANPGHIVYQGAPVGADGQNGWGDGGTSTDGQELHLSIGTCCGATGNSVSMFLGHIEEQLDAGALLADNAFTNTTDWHFVVATMSNLNSGGTPTVRLYVDGALIETNTGTTAVTARNNLNNFFTIGRPIANQRFFDGQLDEVRIADTDRALNWVCAEYSNQNNPGAGLTFTNVAPVLGSMESPALNFTEDGAPIIITANTAITDENDGYMNGATIQITANYASTEDVLAFTNANGISGSWNAGTGRLTLSGTATVANYVAAIRSVTYQNTNTGNPSIAVRTVSFVVTDINGASSNTVSRNIGVTRVNDAPVLANTEATALAYAEGQIASIVTPLTTVADVDNTNLTGATVRISAGYLNTEDVLTFTNTPNITGTWNATTGILTLTGTTTVANYQSAIQSITYQNTNNTTPSTAVRTVSFQVTDGAATSAVVTRNINVTAVNDAPVAVNDAYSTNEDTPLTVAVANRVLLNDTDVEGNALTAVLDVGPANGTLTLNTNGTFTYTPAANFNGSDSFTYHANDGAANSNIATVTITVSAVNDAPVAVNNTYTTNEDTPLTVVLANSILINDTDVDANPLTAALVTGPTQGTLTLNANGTFTYTPGANYNGSDSYTYRANDGTVNSNIATVTITINAVNDAPVAVNNAYTTNEDIPLTIALANSVLVNDTDVEGSALTAVLDAGPANGTLTLNTNGTFTYTPAANYNGSDTFTYHANDGTSNSNIATVTITINAVNDLPVAVNNAYTTNEDTPLTVALANSVLVNDTDVEGSALTAVLDAGPANGTLTLNANGTFTYTPAANYNGSDTFTYHANDGTGNSNIATVTITVSPVNDAPVAVNDTYTTSEDTPLTVVLANSILTNDTDVDANALTAVLVVGPTQGTLTLNANGTFTYTPAANYNGSDSFTYRASDGTVNSNIATVAITVNAVNDAPVAVNNGYTTNEDTPLAVALVNSVLVNDTDVEGSALTAVLVTGPTQGTLTLNANGTFTYTPVANYNGSDSFTYRANDGAVNSNIATVTITINAVNDAPVAVNNAYTTNEDTPLTVALANGVLVNDTDVEGSALTAVLDAGPANGTLTLNANGTFTYTPAANYNGSDTFTYHANDGSGNSNIATVTITINAVNDAPVAVNDNYTTSEDTPLTVVLANSVLINDTDVDANSLTAALLTGPANGTLALNANGTFTYTPGANYNGSDSFTYRANDGTVNSNIASVTITVNAINDAPVAVNNAYTTNEDTPLTVTLASSVLVNDTDGEGNALTAVLDVGPANGTLTLNANGTFTYTPAANYNGSDTFTYHANDGTGNSNIATVSINVSPVNDAPVAVNDAYTTNEETPFTVVLANRVLLNDTDAEGSALTAVLDVAPANGTLTFNSNGTFTYTPAANHNGSDTFTYHTNDGVANSNIATVTITVSPVNDVPVGVNDTYTTSEDTPLNVTLPGTVLVNDTDVDGNPLTAILVTGPANGTLTLNANGTFTYTPGTNYIGSDNFTYRANDGTANSNIATVTITINAVNDAPVAVNNAYTTNEDTPLTVVLANSVLVNDTDTEGNILTAILNVGPGNGTLTLNANGTFTYTPAANYNGSDTFTYHANDGTGNSNIATVTITVSPVNDAPIAVNNAYTTNEDTPLTVALANSVLINDTDTEGSTLTAVLDISPANGTLTLNANGTFTYTPAANYNGSDTFTYHANDGTGNSNIATVTITVSPVNDAPVAVNDAYTTTEDTPITITLPGTVVANDTDIDGNPLTAILVTGPAQGTLTLNANGTFTYTPGANYNGNDSFTYRANDGTINSNIATATITISPVNDAPVAVNDSYATNEDTPLTIAMANRIFLNDTDTEGSALTAVLDVGPANGTLTLNANGTFTYAPAANFNGSDSFTYHANDGTGNSNIATVTITINAVNDVPVAVNDAYTTNEDTPLTVVLANRVLVNDTDVEGSALTAVLDVGPANGTLTLNANGTFNYAPAANYNGNDTFTYHANDGTGNSNIATVTITVSPVNDAPVAVSDGYTTTEDTPLTVTLPGTVLANDTDTDANLLTAILVTSPANGTLTLNANGTFIYTPAANYNGIDNFTYRANDGTINSAAIATVTLTITPVNDAPVAVNNVYATTESTILTVTLANSVLVNDTDAEGSTLTAVLDAGPTNGTLTLNANGTFTYTPTVGYNGNDVFTYHSNDGAANSNIATVTITINAVNDAPVAVNDTYTTNEDAPLLVALPGTILINDTDIDGNPLTAVLDAGPSHGTLTLNSNGTFTYTPAANYNGSDSFTYHASDGMANSNIATVTLTINAINDAPVAVNNAYATNEDTPLTVVLANSVLVNDTDVEGSALTAVPDAGPSNGTLTLNANGTFTYTPAANYNGSDTFTYHANDGTGNSNIATVTITINAINDAPVAVNDGYTTNEDTPLTVTLASRILLNDSDVEGSTLTAVLDAGPSNGTLTLNANGTFTYTPSANYNGSDTFTYHANDGTGNSNIATVTITINAINDVPVAVNDAYNTNEDTPLIVVLANRILLNDTDVEGSALTPVLNAGPSNGSLTLNANGTFTYTPAANYNGSDTFTYHANDGTGNSNIATVTITINAINDVPVAVNDVYVTNEDTPLIVVLADRVLVNDTDVEGSALTAVLDVGPSNGTLILNANGTFTYTPATNYYGSDSFTYRANDGTGNSNIATVTITVNAINDVPIAANDAYSTNEDTPLTVALANRVLVNDTDVEGSTLTAVLDVSPSNGTLTLNANGTFTYTPAANYNGSDSFTYHANDGTGNSNIATVTITINAINDLPVAVNNTYTTNEDAPLTIVVANSVLVNDTDVEGSALTAVLDVGPSNGTLTLNANGTFTYTPAANFNGSDSFTYHANDGTGNSNIATVTITVNAINDAPVAVNDAYTTNEDTPLTIALANRVLVNDTDVEGGALTAVLDAGPSRGTLTLNANGTFTYTPAANYNGSDSFTYHANDGTGNSNMATVTITINAINDVPVAVNDAYTTNEDTPLTVALANTILLNDTDAEGSALTAVLNAGPSNGTMTLNADGTFTYTPGANFNGSDNFTYHANDGTGNSNIATVTITVNAINDAPVAVNNAYVTNEDTPLTIVLANGVLVNDTDTEGTALSAVLDAGPSNGTLSLNANGTFMYIPNGNFNGNDSFTYHANDGAGNSNIAVVTITIHPVNDVPTASNDIVSTIEDTPIGISMLANDSDVEAGIDLSSIVIIVPPVHGTIAINNTTGVVTYTPDVNYQGSDSFTYSFEDVDNAVSNSGSVSLTITPANDAPVATADTYTVNEDLILTVPVNGVLTNDADNDGDAITAALVTSTANGTVVLNPNGGFTYIPNANFNGADAFTYAVNDGTLNSATVTVAITVNPVNDAPVSSNDAVTTLEDTPVTIAILANDMDPDNAPLASSVVITSSPANGTLIVNSTSGQVIYTPGPDFNGSDSFSYTVNDPDGGTSNVATVNITITPVDDAPVAVNDNGNTLENTPVTISLLPNDQSQHDNIDPSSVTIVSNVGNGTLIVDATTGIVTYTPAATFLGSDTFTYTIRDLNGNISNIATVTIIVTPVNDSPVAVDDGPITHNTILPITLDVLANDSDSDNDLTDLTIVSVSTPTLGSVSIENGTIVYQPAGTTSGTATFTYTIRDPDGLTSTATVTIFYEYEPLEVSQGFSPNNSGSNETWFIRSIGSYPNNSIRVFDRWGILVFEARHYDNYSVLWDGRANTGMLSGKNLDEGTYYYIINLGNEAKELTGYVMIVR